MYTGKKQDIIKKISNSLSWNIEYDRHLSPGVHRSCVDTELTATKKSATDSN